MRGVRRVQNYVIFTGDDFLKFYRESLRLIKHPEKKRIKDTAVLRKSIRAIFQAIAESIVENIGGVYLRRLGYFGVWRSASRVVINRNYKSLEINSHSDGYQYILDYFPDTSRNRYVQSLCMDGMFNTKVKKALSKNLRKGYRYKNYYLYIKETNKRRIKI